MLAAGAVVGGLGCSFEPAAERISDDEPTQLRYEAARRTLTEIRARQRRGEPVHADCRAARLLYVPVLEGVERPAVSKLLAELGAACAGAREDPAEETR